MNKKLITLAVAAAMAAPAAALAEATIYGQAHVSLDYADVNNVILPTYGFVTNEDGSVYIDPNGYPVFQKLDNGVDFEGWGMSSRGYIPGESRASRLGVKGSEDLGGGLKAIYQIELGINFNDTNDNVVNNSDSITYRNTFVGLAGNFGTILFGRHDTPMKISTSKLDLFSDTMADYNGTVGFRDLRADNVVAYISPNWRGFQLAGAVVPPGGATAGDGLNLNSDGIAEGYSLAAIYSNGPFYASAAYESLGDEMFNDQYTSVYMSNCDYVGAFPHNPTLVDSPYDGTGGYYGCNYTSEDATAWRFGLGLLDWNGFTLTGIYESRDQEPGSDTFFAYDDPANSALSWSIPGAAHDAELWQIQAGYAFGNNMIKAMYGEATFDSNIYLGSQFVANHGGAGFADYATTPVDYDRSTWGVGFDHNFSKRTKAYVLYTEVDDDREDYVAGTDWSGFSLGLLHKF